MKQHFRFLGPLIGLCIFIAVAWLLYGKLRHFPYSDFVDGLYLITPCRVAMAAGLTGLYYLILIGYDLVAVRYLGHQFPLSKVALASFTGYASSYNFGPLLGGASVRYRLYSLWGLSPLQIAQVVFLVGLTFWLGAIALGSVVFVVKPFDIPPALHLPVADTRTLGWILLSVLAVYLGFCAFRQGRPLKWFGREFSLPPVRMGLMQAGLASTDLLIGTAVFYVLVWPVLGASYSTLLGIYLLSLAAGITAQVPGGMGVFELSVFVLIHPDDSISPKLFTAMVVWRAVFYLMPLLVAAVVLGGHELKLQVARRRRSNPPG